MPKKEPKNILTPVSFVKPPVWSPLVNTSQAADTTKRRRNSSSTIERSDRFKNIEDGLIPFHFSQGYSTNSKIDIRDAVVLCQKAYYNFAIFRNTLDLMTEFSVNNLHFKNGNKKNREFFEAWLNKLGGRSLQDKFFREYYRSGNVFVYRFDTQLDAETMNAMTQTFGETSTAAKKINLPVRYIILNPADIQVGGNISFSDSVYYKLLSDYEVERLRNPKTEEDKQVLENLDSESRKMIKEKRASQLHIQLDATKFVAVFYKKQDYEPFAVPMGYPVLDDINWKAEMKKMDMAMTRTTQQAILLITMGAELKDGTVSVNQKNLEAMQSIFENESVGRVLISDYTTKAQFVIPDIASLLDPKKYTQIDKDIQIGLNNILVGSDEKFSNQAIKIQVFIERLKLARQAFIDEFLLPEIKRIAKSMGMKNYPTPYFEDFSLRDELEYAKVYTRLVELGVLTPDETIKAIETGILPNEEESLEHQNTLRDNKDKGLYEPIVGGPYSQKELAKESAKQAAKAPSNVSAPKGRPSGTSSPKKSTPVGASVNYSLAKLKENILAANDLQDKVDSAFKKKFKLKELTSAQKEISENVASIIMANEPRDNWDKSMKGYIENPVDTNQDAINAIHEIAANHQVDSYVASLLYHSQNQPCPGTE